jgi:hypothetical protein
MRLQRKRIWVLLEFVTHGIAGGDSRIGLDGAVQTSQFESVHPAERNDVEVGLDPRIPEDLECMLQLVPDSRCQGEVVALYVDDDVQHARWTASVTRCRKQARTRPHVPTFR